MKRLVTAKDVEQLIAENKNEILLDENTIITPSAMDLLQHHEIHWRKQTKESAGESTKNESIDTEKLLSILLKIKEMGILDEACLEQLTKKKKYLSDTDISGLKLVDGKSVVMDDLPDAPNVQGQTVINEHMSSLEAGFLTLKQSSYQKKCPGDLVVFVISGRIQISINRNLYNAKAGDVIFIPSEVEHVIKTSTEAELHYTIHHSAS